MSRAAYSTLLAVLVGLAGCSGPMLIVETRAPAQISVKPTHDGAGVDLPPETPFTAIGQAPAEWEVPLRYLGGRAYVKAVFESGTREVFVELPKDEDADDRKVSVGTPQGLRN